MLAIGLSMLLAVTPATTTTSTTVAQTCVQPDVTPFVSYSAPTPALVASSGAHGTTQLIVTLGSEGGAPTNVALLSSSGIPFLDQAAMKQAQHSKFAPEMVDCSAVGGRYIYTVEY